MMGDELLFVVDDENHPKKPLFRHDVIRNQLWRRSAGAMIVDKANDMVLCHQRSKNKDERPNYWVCTFGGKCLASENSVDAAVREVNEELGVILTKNNMNYCQTYKSDERRQFEYVFLIFTNHKKFEYTFDVEEVSSVSWLAIEDLRWNLLYSNKWYFYGFELNVLNSLMT